MADWARITALRVQLFISGSHEKVSPKSFVVGNEARDKGVCAHTYVLPGVAQWNRSLYLCVHRGLWLPPQPGAVLYPGLPPARPRQQASRPANQPVSSEVSSAGSLPGRSQEMRACNRPEFRTNHHEDAVISSYIETAQPLPRSAPPHPNLPWYSGQDTEMFPSFAQLAYKRARVAHQQAPINKSSG